MNRRHLLQLLATTMAGPAILANTAFAAADPRPVHIPAAAGKKGKIGEGDIHFKLNSQQTSGLMGTTESVLPPGLLGAPPHSHKGFDEICRVLEGTLTIMVGDEVFKVNAGDWHLRPRGIVHTFWNDGKVPAKFIEICAPGGHEAYMSELSELFVNNARPKPGDLDKLATKYDIAFDWPKLPVVMQKYGVHL
ncbi:cupin domain-containing protein [Mucilaginibacter myungsuensis]|uniref:Cupin domain-containing protein n=1 Tax=Mucilaginibacter myungsuensis TaxID=649104 RepID=A0A929KVQ4_9SPHI|nr:cupin domain-containing protein [Mucilaginibacter myungsuensis]MBE9662484.1 cupin domain-containing protein [Mucilaginibacter myungsuensis]MDN3597903.1 cupin domain-containing protein [Mucilaginibacter myungsuensis]